MEEFKNHFEKVGSKWQKLDDSRRRLFQLYEIRAGQGRCDAAGSMWRRNLAISEHMKVDRLHTLSISSPSTSMSSSR